ncbi:gamma-aminobutyric acid type B receptor subunit 1-like isoform X2 [Corticium candelabrum]|uniref:gamma-aminobutyric acid type B receptor subunit 1-like isoform X2 n=1 Tax=Corticium candelabrum TaxID=121492 RepID=UPI002E2762A8|nr:gamma-aminobutyric acid type B receptor subunit 1-like isoform X2 [Corticium candelabrum]
MLWMWRRVIAPALKLLTFFHLASSSNSTQELTLSVILPFDGGTWCQGHNILPAIRMARDIINQKGLIPGYNLTTEIHNGKCDVSEGLESFIDSLLARDRLLVGFVGPGCSSSAKPIGAVSRQYPFISISYSAESSELSNSVTYPYFLRTVPPAGELQKLWLALLKHYGWFRFALVIQNDHAGFSTDWFQQELLDDPLFNWSDVTLISTTQDGRSWDPVAVIKELQKNDIRIILAMLFEDHARELMCAAYKMGLTGCRGEKQYVWIFPGWYDSEWWYRSSCNEQLDTNCPGHMVLHALNGYLVIQNQYFTDKSEDEKIAGGLTVKQWHEKYESYRKVYQEELRGRNETVTLRERHFGSYAYDAVFTWVYALNKFFQEGNRPKFHISDDKSASKKIGTRLKEIMTGVKFSGISGEVKFNGNDRIANLTVRNFVNGTYRTVATYDTITETFTHENVLVNWGNGCDATIPRDRAVEVFHGCSGLTSFALLLGSCAKAVAIVSSLGFLVVLLIILLLFFRYHRKFEATRKRMNSLGLMDRKRRSLLLNVDDFEVSRSTLQLNRKLGEGCFGAVYGGEGVSVVDGEERTPIAVKALRPGAEPEEKVLFLEEVQVMKQFIHPNIVRLIGVCTKEEPICAVMELMVYGDLKSYLLSHRLCLTSPDLQWMAVQVGRGVEYLHSRQFVHRDIASRNCMVTLNKTTKLGDFGLTRKVGDSSDYYRYRRSGLLPIRWMAPESIRNGIFATSSDVWSFGILLFEIITLAGFPYQEWSNYQVIENVSKGLTIQLPAQCHSELKGTMTDCWIYEADRRPTISVVLSRIEGDTRSQIFVPCTETLPEIINAANEVECSVPADTSLPVRKRTIPVHEACSTLVRRFSESAITKMVISQDSAKTKTSGDDCSLSRQPSIKCPRHPLSSSSLRRHANKRQTHFTCQESYI